MDVCIVHSCGALTVNVFTYVHMYVCMYACMYLYVCIYYICVEVLTLLPSLRMDALDV